MIGAASCGMAPPFVAHARRLAFQWPAGAAGAVSITYDDGLGGQLDHAIPQLEERHWRGTFFLTRANMIGREEEWRAAGARGDALENHTLTHPCDLRRYSPTHFIDREVEPMERYLDSIFPERRQRLYAYPCDATNLGSGSRSDFFNSIGQDRTLRVLNRGSGTCDGGGSKAALHGRDFVPVLHELADLPVGYLTRRARIVDIEQKPASGG
jgi:peptidoglycan/xylan/chitin deacetylase (PgdA/CDA1 family)